MEQIKLDIVPSGITPIAHASQNDVGRNIRFNLYNGDSEYTLTGSEAINITLKKPDGTTRTQGLTNTLSNYVVYTSTDGDLDAAGVYSCELTIYKGDAILGSRNFVLKVEPDAYDGANVVVMDCGPADICTFETNLADNLVSLIANITASGGGGTPSTPIPIVGHSELNLTRCGINLFDEQTETGYYDSATGEKKPLASEIRSTNLIPVMPNTNYAKVGLVAGYSFIFFDRAKNYITRYTTGGLTFTTPANCYYIGINFGGNYGNTYNHDVSINYPATAYVPYNGQTFTVQFGQTVYGGVYDKSGRLTINHATADEDTFTNYDGQTSPGGLHWVSATVDNVQNGHAVCSMLEVKNTDAGWVSTTPCMTMENGRLIIYTDKTSLADFKTYYDGLQIAYELATPIEIDVSELSVDTIVGVNNVFADTGETELKYLKIEG